MVSKSSLKLGPEEISYKQILGFLSEDLSIEAARILWLALSTTDRMGLLNSTRKPYISSREESLLFMATISLSNTTKNTC